MKMKIATMIAALLCVCFLQSAQSQSSFWIQTGGPGTGYDVRSFTVNSHGHLFAGTWTDGSIWKTTDNGGSWSKCGAVPDPNPVLSMCTNRGDHVFAGVYLKGMYRSTDGGASWQMKSSGLTNLAMRAALVDDSAFVWVATEGGLFRSTDDGESWVLKQAGAFAAVFLDSSHAIVTNDFSFAYRSLNHGNSWTTIPQSGIAVLGGVHADGSYYGASITSEIFRSTDFGATWADMHSGVSWSGYTYAFTFTPGGDVFFIRDGYATGVLASLDGGKTWNVLNDGLTTTRVMQLFYHPNGFVFLGTNGAGVFRSRLPVGVKAATLLLQASTLDFGDVKVGLRDTLRVQISNGGISDTLRIGSIVPTSQRFTVSPSAMVLAPHASQMLSVIYTPTAAAPDTGSILISSNDIGTPVFSLKVSGQGYGLGHAPFIHQINLIPNNSGQARIFWFRSIDDSAGAADPVVQYSIWRRVLGTGNQSTRSPIAGLLAPTSTAAAWDFILTVPAIALDEYAAIVPIPYVPSAAPPWYVFIVVAQTKSMQVYTSLPDSIQDPAPLTGTTGGTTGQIPGELLLKQNFPNPFNPSTTISYGLPQKANVSLVVYNTLGQAIATLVNREEEAGYHVAHFDGSTLASGVYFCRLTAGEFVRTSKLLLLK
jgi:photosystem II stability/assembly factor-like uncharacterized protein